MDFKVLGSLEVLEDGRPGAPCEAGRRIPEGLVWPSPGQRRARPGALRATGRGWPTHDLGIEPSHELRELEKAILQQDRSLGLALPTEAEADVVEAAMGAFVGRGRELEELFQGFDATSS